MNLRRGAVIGLALLLLPLLSSCVSVLNPTGWAPVVFDSDTAYVVTSKGRLSAITINGDSGTAKWTFPDPDRDSDDDFKTKAIYGAPVIEGDRIYFTTFEGGVFALNKADGRPIWPQNADDRTKIDGDIAGGLAISGDNLYFGTTEGRLYAWKKADGSPAQGWEEPKTFDGGIWASPVIHGDTLFIGTMKGAVHGLSLADGSDKWEAFDTSAAIPEISLVNDEQLFAASINHHGYLISTANGQQVAEFEANDWLWTAPAADGERIFFGDFGGTAYGVDITSTQMNQAWTASTDARIRSGPAVIDDVVIFPDRKPVIWFLNAADGTTLNSVPYPDVGTFRANLTVKDGAAYLVSTDGKLFRADPQPRKVVEISLSGVKK